MSTKTPNTIEAITNGLQQVGRVISDGWMNLRTGIGTRRDRTTYNVPTIDHLAFNDLSTLYRASDILRKAVDEPAAAAFRKGYRLSIADGDGEDTEAMRNVASVIESTGLEDKLKTLLRWQRQYGGAVLFVGANDGQRADMPLNEDRITSIDFLTLLDRRECVPVDWYDRVNHPRYGQPSFYRVTPYAFSTQRDRDQQHPERDPATREFAPGSWVDVHESRIIPLFGPRGDLHRTSGYENGWGDSIYLAIWKIVADYDHGVSAAASLLSEASVPVFKVKNLAALMAQDKSDVLKKRVELLNMTRSVINGIMVDADGEDFERKAATLTGYDSVLMQLAQRVATAIDYPMTLLFGRSPSGLNATGDSDITFWNSRILQIQRTDVVPAYKRALRLIMLAKQGPTRGVLPDSWSLEPNPLEEPTEAGSADTNLRQAQADQIYLDRGVVSVEEIRGSRWGGPKFSTTTTIDDSIDSDTDDEIEDEEGAPRVDPESGETKDVPRGGSLQPKGGSAEVTPQDQAMNGAQVSSLVEVVKAVTSGEIPRESGAAIVELAFRLSPADALRVLGPKDFEPKDNTPPQLAPGAQPPAPPERTEQGDE